MENLEAMAMADLEGFMYNRIWYVTDITWESWTCYPIGSTGCPMP